MTRDGIGGNSPPVILELTPEEAAFLMDNCESNMQMGMKMLLAVQAGTMSLEAGQATVALVEKFRPIHAKLRAAGVVVPE